MVQHAGLLGRGVARGAYGFVAERRIQLRAAGQPEVDERRGHDGAATVGVDHDVARFHVAVQQAQLVRCLKCCRDVTGDDGGVRNVQRAAPQPFGQRLARQQRHGEVEPVAVAADAEQATEARAAQPGT